MNTLSPDTQVRQYEIWLYHRPGYHEPVQACGLFGSREDARRVGSALRMWLHLGVWARYVFDALLPPDSDPDSDAGRDRADLLGLPDHLARLGCDPARVLVTVPLFGAAHDNEAACDGSEDDTLLDPPAAIFSPADGDEAA